MRISVESEGKRTMKADKEYTKAIEKAKENYADMKERGADAIGGNALEFMEGISTPEEIGKQKKLLLESTKELHDSMRDILDNGTLEQKVDLLVMECKTRMVNEEFKMVNELQNYILNSCLKYSESDVKRSTEMFNQCLKKPNREVTRYPKEKGIMVKSYRQIEKEAIFLFNGIQFSFQLDDYTREFGHLITRFHVITNAEILKDFMKEKTFFKGELLKCNIPLKCYLAAVSYDVTSELYKVNIVGEEIVKEGGVND